MSGRILVIDADLPRLRAELRSRGYEALSLAELSLHRLEDEPMLELLVARLDPASFVLVTSDDKMPLTHEVAVRQAGLSVATIDGRWQKKGYLDQDTWRRDTVHRWAHRMTAHGEKEIRRYSPRHHSVWTPRL